MSKLMRTALLVVLGVVMVGSAAMASVPDPTNSICPTGIAYGPSGFIDLVVTVRNATGANIVGSNVQMDFQTNGVNWCTNQAAGVTRTGNILAAVTDGSGNAHFPVRAGNCSNTSQIKIYADGLLLCTYAYGATVDLVNNDLSVNVADLGAFAVAQTGQDICGDYNGDGAVNVADLGTFAQGQSAGGCP